MKKIALIAGSIALAATPALAETQRKAEPITQESKLGEGTNIAGLIFALIAAGVIAGAIFFSGDSGEDEPISA
ncbi:MAG: hypothetical protein ABJ242_07540 [Marinomonas sp.]